MIVNAVTFRGDPRLIRMKLKQWRFVAEASELAAEPEKAGLIWLRKRGEGETLSWNIP